MFHAKYHSLGDCRAAVSSDEFVSSPDSRLAFFDFFFSSATVEWRGAEKRHNTTTTGESLKRIHESPAAPECSAATPTSKRSPGKGKSKKASGVSESLDTSSSSIGNDSWTLANSRRAQAGPVVPADAVGMTVVDGWLEIALIGVQDPWSLIRRKAVAYVAQERLYPGGFSSAVLTLLLSSWSRANEWYEKEGLLMLMMQSIFPPHQERRVQGSGAAAQPSTRSSGDPAAPVQRRHTRVTSSKGSREGAQGAPPPPRRPTSTQGQGAHPTAAPRQSGAQGSARGARANPPVQSPMQSRPPHKSTRILHSSARTAANRSPVQRPSASHRCQWPEQAMTQILSLVAIPSLNHEQLPVREAAIDLLECIAEHYPRLRSFLVDHVVGSVVAYAERSEPGAKSSRGGPASVSRGMDLSTPHRSPHRVAFLVDGVISAPAEAPSITLHGLEGALRCASRMSATFVPLMAARQHALHQAVVSLASHTAASVRQQVAELWSSDHVHGLSAVLNVFVDQLPESEVEVSLLPPTGPATVQHSRIPSVTSTTTADDRDIPSIRPDVDVASPAPQRSCKGTGVEEGWQLRETLLMALCALLVRACAEKEVRHSGALSSDSTPVLLDPQQAAWSAPLGTWPPERQARFLLRIVACAMSSQFEISRMGKQVLPLTVQYLVRCSRASLPFVETVLEQLHAGLHSCSDLEGEGIGSLPVSRVLLSAAGAPRRTAAPPPVLTWVTWFAALRGLANPSDQLKLAAAIANLPPMRRLKHTKHIYADMSICSMDGPATPGVGLAGEMLVRLPSDTSSILSARSSIVIGKSISIPVSDLAAAVIVIATYNPHCPQYITAVASQVDTWKAALNADVETIRFAMDFAAVSLQRRRRPGHLRSPAPDHPHADGSHRATSTVPERRKLTDETGDGGDGAWGLLRSVSNRTSTLHLIPVWLTPIFDMETHQQCLTLRAVHISLEEICAPRCRSPCAARQSRSAGCSAPLNARLTDAGHSNGATQPLHVDPGRLGECAAAPLTDSTLRAEGSQHHYLLFGYIDDLIAPALQDGGEGVAHGFEWMQHLHPTVHSLPSVNLCDAMADAAAAEAAWDSTPFFRKLTSLVVTDVKRTLFGDNTDDQSVAGSRLALYLQPGVEPCVLHQLRTLLLLLHRGSLASASFVAAALVTRLNKRYPQWSAAVSELVASGDAVNTDDGSASGSDWDADSSDDGGNGFTAHVGSSCKNEIAEAQKALRCVIERTAAGDVRAFESVLHVEGRSELAQPVLALCSGDRSRPLRM